MKINNKEINIDEIIEKVNIDKNIPIKRKNGIVLRETHIEILKKYNINYENHANLKSLIFEIEEILSENQEEMEELEELSYELSEIDYYNYTNK